MKCPIDGVDLVMSERQGVEIDYCPTCRGIWLDRGELDKILDRAATELAPAPPAPPAVPASGEYPPQQFRDEPVAPSSYPAHPRPGGPYDTPVQDTPSYGAPAYGYRDDRRDRDDRRYDDRRGGYDPRREPRNQPYRKKKESWLSDLLDFD